MAPLVDLFLWPLIFQFLEAEDLVSVSAVCFSWWQFVFRGRVSSPIQRALARCDEISLANTGSLYLRPCLHGVGDPGLVGLVSFVFTL